MTLSLLARAIRAAGLAIFFAFVAIPLLLHSAYLATVGIFIGIHAIVAVGLGLLMGYAGQVSLGHAAFYGLGAYSSAILTTRLGLSPLPAMVAGTAITAIIALILGTPTLRLHGHYLAMFTLAFGIIIQTIFNQAERLTRGTSGIVGIPPFSIGPLRFDTVPKAYLLVLAVLALTIFAVRNLVNSRSGRALRALHESEVAASVCGVDVPRAKLEVFVLSAILASVAGSLYAHFVNYVSPVPFGFGFSVQLLVMVVVGGAGSVWGPLAGAALFTVLSQFLQKTGERIAFVGTTDTVLFGMVLVAVVIFLQKGLVSLPSRLRGEATPAEDSGI